MLLTDPAVQYWSCVIAILVTAAVLMLWNKVHGPRLVTGVSRFGLLLGGYAATAVAVLVSVNIAYGGLIVSVSDLFAQVNPPMGQFVNHGGCGHGQSREIEARAMAAVTASAPSSANAQDPGREYGDADAPPPGVDPALGGGGGFGRPCAGASSAAATSTATPASATGDTEAHALK
jgi:hypothetical protein